MLQHLPNGFDPEKAARLRGAECLGDASAKLLAEHRLDIVCNIWDAAWGDRFAPRWSEIDLLGFPAELRGGVMVADVIDGGGDFYVRFWGVELVDAFGVELSGKRLSEVDHRGIMDSFIETAPKMIEGRQPQKLVHRIRLASGLRRDFPDIRFPLSEDGVNVTAIMTVENIRKCMALRASLGATPHAG